MFRFCLAQLKMYMNVMLMMRTTNPQSSIEAMKTDMDVRDEEKKKEKETSTYTTIEKELYICALTNLPRTTHTLWRRVKHILFFISPLFSFVFFFAENVVKSRRSQRSIRKQINNSSFLSLHFILLFLYSQQS